MLRKDLGIGFSHPLQLKELDRHISLKYLNDQNDSAAIESDLKYFTNQSAGITGSMANI